MITTIRARYRNGIIEPLEKISLANNALITITIDTNFSVFEKKAKRQYKQNRELRIGSFGDVIELGIAFYNAESHQDLTRFLDNIEGEELLPIFRRASEELDWLQKRQIEFRDILGIIIGEKVPSDKQVEIIKQYIIPTVDIVSLADGSYCIKQISIPDNHLWIMDLYRWLVDLVNMKAKMPKICASEDCNKIFVQRHGGKLQKYCSERCENRESQRRHRVRLKKC